MTVSVYTSSGGSLLASGTLTGNTVELTFTGSSGTYWVEVTGITPRFNSYAQNVSITCGVTTDLTLTVASGYACAGDGCFWPIATTLTLTDSKYGNATLTYSGGTWTGNLNISYAGGGSSSCTAGTITLTYTYTSGRINVVWLADTVGGGFVRQAVRMT